MREPSSDDRRGQRSNQPKGVHNESTFPGPSILFFLKIDRQTNLMIMMPMMGYKTAQIRIRWTARRDDQD